MGTGEGCSSKRAAMSLHRSWDGARLAKKQVDAPLQLITLRRYANVQTMSDKTFTIDELKQFDGKDGRPTYFACQGLVYDASNSRLWRNGIHVRNHHAGLDLTADLEKAPHGLESVQRCPVVGTLAGADVVAPVATQAPVTEAAPEVQPAAELKAFTTEELASFDGKEGRAAYFAYDGHVYDATKSKLWRNGTHVRSHEAGRDLTPDLNRAPHGVESIQRLPVVGTFVAPAQPEAAPETDVEDDGIPAYATFMYRMHSHPASVHFPIALCVAASFLHFVALIWECPTCETVAYWNLIMGLVTSPLPIFSGFVDWVYQFGGRPTRLFLAKIVLSVVFLVAGGLVLVLRHFGGGEPTIIYHLLYLSFAPQVLALGFIGGRVTFPT